MKRFLTILAIAALISGCAKTSSVKQTATPPAPQSAIASAATAAAPMAPMAAESASAVTGKVLETENAAGYTYVKLRTAAGDQWAAISEAKIVKGQTLTIDAQMTIDNFESKSLNRKFDKIIFGSVAGVTSIPAGGMMSSAPMPAGHPSVTPPAAGASSPMGTAAQHMAGPANVGDVVVPKADGPNAMTAAEIWSGKDSLNDKTVVIRGKVVKSLSGIMGRNWIHLRDGSGSAAAGTNDITVTTTETANVGDIVIVSGVVHVDKDFGAGYRYPVIVENASIRK